MIRLRYLPLLCAVCIVPNIVFAAGHTFQDMMMRALMRDVAEKHALKHVETLNLTDPGEMQKAYQAKYDATMKELSDPRHQAKLEKQLQDMARKEAVANQRAQAERQRPQAELERVRIESDYKKFQAEAEANNQRAMRAQAEAAERLRTASKTATPQRGMPPTQTGKPPGGRGGAWPVVVASLLWDMRPNQTLYDLNDTITRYKQKIHDMYWLDRHGQLTRAQDRELINMEIEVEKLRKERDRLRREAAAANPPRIRPPAGYDPLAPVIDLPPSDLSPLKPPPGPPLPEF